MGKAPDLNDVTAFVAAAKAGTLSGAARDMGLPTSTVSRALTRLEEHVGVLLIRRNQRGLVLTDVGFLALDGNLPSNFVRKEFCK
ncbi:LysR family transcriptional regulator [Tunturibacter empetritectus]|uniref:DNA-binding transcriptional LysR family regulator n=1 Tax=Tunturiibacter empetritectus TaxID=3069691 RepID=A0A7W8INF1_9BACT|nr:DNA-binding transcriptional LysR family regulator [Edaphobacter lichenicola]